MESDNFLKSENVETRSSEGEIYDVIIIGAGLSGLTAAYRLFLKRQNLKFLILEAKDRIGGRVLSLDLPARNNTTDVWDMGGTWIGSSTLQPFINRLMEDLNISKFPQKFKGKKLLQTGKNFEITEYDYAIPDIGLVSLLDTATLIKYFNNIQKKMPTTIDEYDKDMLKFDSSTAETFIQNKIWTNCTFDCTRAAIRAITGSELSKLSTLYLIAFSNSCGGFFNLIESGESSSHAYKISGGAQGICSKIIELIGSNHLKLETIVSAIEKVHNDEESYSLIRTTSGTEYRAKNVIVAIPPNLITNIQFEPQLSPTKFEFFSSVAPAHYIKVILTYESAFWIKDGYSGEIVTNGGKSQTVGCTSGPLCVVFDGTTENKNPALICIICGDQALQYENRTKLERKEAVLKSIESFFKNNLVRNYIVYCEKIWRHEQFIGGCPLCTVPPGVAKHLNSNLRAPENEIHFAGAELAENWMGLMEGAVQSGERAASQILSYY